MVTIATTAAATLFLGAINPFLACFLAYDYYLILGFTKVLNQTTFALVLDDTKRHVFLNRLNFLGYTTAFKEEKVNLRNIKYMGIYKNNFITLDHRGLLPSFSKMIESAGLN